MTALAETLTAASREKLRAASISTLTTCLYRRGLRRTWLSGLVPAATDQPRMVGEAFTLRFIPAREDIGGMTAYAAGPSLHQRAFEECPPGHVLVADTHGETEACTCGDLLVARLKARGAAGIVTDGGFRDTAEIAGLGFPAYQRSPAPPPSFLALHAVELNGPVGCAGIAIYPGDIMVGDSEGVIAIPAAIANAVADEAFEMTGYEAFAAERIAGGSSIYGIYPPTDQSRADYAEWARREKPQS
jgi:regulator of RNase E activity RraA